MSWMKLAACCRLESSLWESKPHFLDGVPSNCSLVKYHRSLGLDKLAIYDWQRFNNADGVTNLEAKVHQNKLYLAWFYSNNPLKIIAHLNFKLKSIVEYKAITYHKKKWRLFVASLQFGTFQSVVCAVIFSFCRNS